MSFRKSVRSQLIQGVTVTEQKVHKVHEFHKVHPGKRHPRESDCRAMLAPLGLKSIDRSYGVSNKSILT